MVTTEGLFAKKQFFVRLKSIISQQKLCRNRFGGPGRATTTTNCLMNKCGFHAANIGGLVSDLQTLPLNLIKQIAILVPNWSNAVLKININMWHNSQLDSKPHRLYLNGQNLMRKKNHSFTLKIIFVATRFFPQMPVNDSLHVTETSMLPGLIQNARPI